MSRYPVIIVAHSAPAVKPKIPAGRIAFSAVALQRDGRKVIAVHPVATIVADPTATLTSVYTDPAVIELMDDIRRTGDTPRIVPAITLDTAGQIDGMSVIRAADYARRSLIRYLMANGVAGAGGRPADSPAYDLAQDIAGPLSEDMTQEGATAILTALADNPATDDHTLYLTARRAMDAYRQRLRRRPDAETYDPDAATSVHMPTPERPAWTTPTPCDAYACALIRDAEKLAMAEMSDKQKFAYRWDKLEDSHKPTVAQICAMKKISKQAFHKTLNAAKYRVLQKMCDSYEDIGAAYGLTREDFHDAVILFYKKYTGKDLKIVRGLHEKDEKN